MRSAAVDKAPNKLFASVFLFSQPDVVTATAHSIREALAPFVHGQAVPLPASIWIVTARGN